MSERTFIRKVCPCGFWNLLDGDWCGLCGHKLVPWDRPNNEDTACTLAAAKAQVAQAAAKPAPAAQ
eukprot:6041572-Karenia_brevis.AAC.1